MDSFKNKLQTRSFSTRGGSESKFLISDNLVRITFSYIIHVCAFHQQQQVVVYSRFAIPQVHNTRVCNSINNG